MICSSRNSERRSTFQESKLVRLFSKPYEQRSNHENEFLIKALKQMPFFAKEISQDETFYKLLQASKVETRYGGPSVVFHPGEMTKHLLPAVTAQCSN